MQLNSNAYAPLRGYALANDSTRLLFVYQVGDGEATPPGVGLDLAQYTGIQLNGGIIKSARTGRAADLSSMGSGYGSGGEYLLYLMTLPLGSILCARALVFQSCN